MKYNKLKIYFFSGTGNARFAANTIISYASQKGIETELIDISKNGSVKFQNEENTLIGFCYPTHGFDAPPNVLNFIRRFPKGDSDVFFLNTRAGMKLFNIQTPGLGGLALWLPAIIMRFKGYKPIGFRPLDMPSNWISLHPGLTAKANNFLYSECSLTLEKFSHRILTGRKVLDGLLWLPIDILISPIAVLYFLFGRFAIAKTFYANYNCTNCGLCSKQCPVQAIKKISNRPYWGFSCESCMKCMNSCPQRAIETSHGYSFLLWWISMSVLPAFIVNELLNTKIISSEFYNLHPKLITYIIILSTCFIFIFLGYRIMHQLLRIRIINKIITYTSLTHYKFWKRYLLKNK